MAKPYLLGVFSVLFVAACSSDRSREPASTPFVGGAPVPNRQAPKPQQPTHRREPAPAATPAPAQAEVEAVAPGCMNPQTGYSLLDETKLRHPRGAVYSVKQLIRQAGEVSYMMSPTMRGEFYGVTGRWDWDADLFRAWMGDEASAPGTPYFNAGQGTYTGLALQYVHNSFFQGVSTKQMFETAPKMAGILVALRVMAGKPECTKQILEYARRRLGNDFSQLEANPWVRIAQMDEARAMTLVAEVDEQYGALDGEVKELDERLKDIEKVRAEDLAWAKEDLQRGQKRLNDDIAQQIPACANTISFRPGVNAEGLVSLCRTKVQEQLKKYRDRNNSDVRRYANLERQRERNGERRTQLEREEANGRNVSASLRELEQSEQSVYEQMQVLEKEKDASNARVERLQRYLDLLDKRLDSSIMSQLAEIQELEKKKMDLSGAYQGPELKELTEKRSRLRDLGPTWFSYKAVWNQVNPRPDLAGFTY